MSVFCLYSVCILGHAEYEQNTDRIRTEYGQNTAEYGQNTFAKNLAVSAVFWIYRIRAEYRAEYSRIQGSTEYGQNTDRIRLEYGEYSLDKNTTQNG